MPVNSPSSHWVHDLDPVMLDLGFLEIRYYGLAYLLGLLLGWWLLRREAARGVLPIHPVQVGDLATWIGIGMIVGGRLGYCLGYEPHLFTDVGGDFPWWGVLRIHEGGMASHGGLAGFFIACLGFSRRYRVSFPIVTDLVAAVAPIGVALGRLANFINGELWGRAGEVPWAMHFPNSIREWARGCRDGGAAFLERFQAWAAQTGQTGIDFTRYQRILTQGDDATPYLLGLYHERAADLGAGSPEWETLVRSMTEPRHPSQLYAMVLEGILLFAVTWPIFRRSRRPGLASAAALGLYGVGRFVGEFWREPDMGYELFFGWMSKGQLYTIPVLIGAGIYAWYVWRRGPQPELYRPDGR